MAQLHQQIAIRDNLKGQLTTVKSKVKELFSNKTHHFSQTSKTTTYLDENIPSETVIERSLETSIAEEIKFLAKHLAANIDNEYQIDIGNTHARADVEVNGMILLKEIPATHLLYLEHQIETIKELLGSIPTLDPAKGFTPDPDVRAGAYRAREIKRQKTRKQHEVIKKFDPTQHHPGQADMVVIDQIVGTIYEQEWSSLISLSKKTELLEQADELIRGLKAARSKANNVPVTSEKIGAVLVGYLFKPLNI